MITETAYLQISPVALSKQIQLEGHVCVWLQVAAEWANIAEEKYCSMKKNL